MVMLLGVSWLMLMPGPHLFYEGEDDDPAFTLTGTGYLRGTLSMLPARARHSDPQGRDIVFSTITSITLWCIWKSRCVEVLGSASPSTVHTLSEIWLEIVHTLRSQWDALADSSENGENRRGAFLKQWSRSGFLFSVHQGRDYFSGVILLRSGLSYTHHIDHLDMLSLRT